MCLAEATYKITRLSRVTFREGPFALSLVLGTRRSGSNPGRAVASKSVAVVVVKGVGFYLFYNFTML